MDIACWDWNIIKQRIASSVNASDKFNYWTLQVSYQNTSSNQKSKKFTIVASWIKFTAFSNPVLMFWITYCSVQVLKFDYRNDIS